MDSSGGITLRVRRLLALGVLAAMLLVPSLEPAAAGPSKPAVAAQTTYFAEGWYVTPRSLRHRPRRMWLSGNGTFQLTRMHWRAWGGPQAVGVGRGRLNDCQPSCADGTMHPYSVRVVFFRPRHRCGYRLYTRARHTYLGRVPAGLPRTFHWGASPVCGS